MRGFILADICPMTCMKKNRHRKTNPGKDVKTTSIFKLTFLKISGNNCREVLEKLSPQSRFEERSRATQWAAMLLCYVTQSHILLSG